MEKNSNMKWHHWYRIQKKQPDRRQIAETSFSLLSEKDEYILLQEYFG